MRIKILVYKSTSYPAEESFYQAEWHFYKAKHDAMPFKAEPLSANESLAGLATLIGNMDANVILSASGGITIEFGRPCAINMMQLSTHILSDLSPEEIDRFTKALLAARYSEE